VKPLRPRWGFTLLEVLLVLGLVALLGALAMVTFGNRRDVEALQDGVATIETAMRMARAEAANLGRRLQLAFDAQGAGVSVLWEPEPLAEPGKFAEYTGCSWRKNLDLTGIRIDRCAFTGASAYRALEPATAAGGSTESVLAPITFEPDGSSDSVVVELVGASDPEARRGFIELDGATGSISTRILTAAEMAKK
jgi:type II secretory pathway pseudopilin PulG